MNKQKNAFDKLQESDLTPLNADLFNDLSVEQLEERLETGCVINYGCEENDGCGANDGDGSEEEIKDESAT